MRRPNARVGASRPKRNIDIHRECPDGKPLRVKALAKAGLSERDGRGLTLATLRRLAALPRDGQGSR